MPSIKVVPLFSNDPIIVTPIAVPMFRQNIKKEVEIPFSWFPTSAWAPITPTVLSKPKARPCTTIRINTYQKPFDSFNNTNNIPESSNSAFPIINRMR